jgi:hypothetical protein
MSSYRICLRDILVAALGTLIATVPAIGADELILQKTFDGSVDRVYAAEVQAVGPTLKSSVKEACLVNFRTTSGSYVEWWTATCKDIGSGKVSVTLAVQGDWFPGVGGQRKKVANTFWNNVDAAIKSNGSSGAATPPSPQVPQANSEDLAVVQVSSEPSGADITLDGDYAGSTPSKLKLKPGSHSVKITKKGFATWERSIKIQAGESRSIAAELEKSN